ncbi:hypothetical protein [Asticcacaulis sp. 201]|uniref:hypothetical protein n=1 Tax=Asticcacaulis sp. 201 TaxID=3028787 RepID=UPI0029163438|nr:hypothetical protein [Asticcacaulis sp. 201]MDV6333227.1 hypothetical protein [Asticcacaulis sp. 201]
MSSKATRIDIDTVDFQISCRRFTIRAMVTRDRQMPVVDEFVLRLLAVVDQMPVARMRAWFGFSEGEIETVLVDLSRRRLVEFDGDNIVLAPAARDLFRSVSDDGVPQIVEIAPLIGEVWFDLVSRTMVPRSRARNVDYLVKIVEQPNARQLPEAFAREAFEENFRDYARRIRRFADPNAINLYSISDVEGGGYAYQVLTAGLVLDLEGLNVRPTFPELGDDVLSFHRLTVAANDAWQSVTVPEASTATAAEFEKVTGQTYLSGLIQAPGEMAEWKKAVTASPKDPSLFLPNIGAAYLEVNRTKLLDEISKAKANGKTIEILWLRPNGSGWGRTLQLAECVQKIRDALSNIGHKEITASIVMPRSTPKTARGSHKKLFDKGKLLPQGHLPSNLEALVIPGIAAIVNVHLPVGKRSVPVGGILLDQKRLAKLAERLSPQADGWENLWQPIAKP